MIKGAVPLSPIKYRSLPWIDSLLRNVMSGRSAGILNSSVPLSNCFIILAAGDSNSIDIKNYLVDLPAWVCLSDLGIGALINPQVQGFLLQFSACVIIYFSP